MAKQQIGGLIVLFGATGDLAKNALIPAFHQLYKQGKISKQFALVGASRSDKTDEEYRDLVREEIQDQVDDNFFQHLYYQPTDNTKLAGFEQLAERIKQAAEEHNVDGPYVYYYSIPPSLYDETTTNLKESGILAMAGSHRVVVEKPFGDSLASAEEYYNLLKNAFGEEGIYLIDHILGVDAVQNILATRYYNPILEAIWNREYIDHVQISLPEHMSVGSRGSFYDENGALLDMFQNHILQILTFVAMALPDDFSAESLNEQKLALLKEIPAFTVEEVKNKVARGQYDEYREEKDVPAESVTETYVAVELKIESDRWHGVPFYIRTGKSLVESHNTVDVILKGPAKKDLGTPNRITFSIAPGAGISFVVNQLDPTAEKEPAPTFVGPSGEVEEIFTSQPYEVLLTDVLQAKHTHFTTYAQVKEQWRITDSIRKGWQELPSPSFPNYETGSVGPKEAEELLAKNKHQWIYRD